MGCWLATNGFKPDGDWLAGPLQLQVNWIEDVDGGDFQLQEAEIADVGLSMLPFLSSEEVHWRFCGSSTGQGGDRNRLSVTLGDPHEDEVPAGEYTWVARDWTRPSNSAFLLTKRYPRTKVIDNFSPTTAATTITLRHAPQQIDLG